MQAPDLAVWVSHNAIRTDAARPARPSPPPGEAERPAGDARCPAGSGATSTSCCSEPTRPSSPWPTATPWPEASAEATEATTQLRALPGAHLGFEDSDVVPLYSRRMLGAAPLAFNLVWYASRRRYRPMAGDAFGPTLTAGALT